MRGATWAHCSAPWAQRPVPRCRRSAWQRLALGPTLITHAGMHLYFFLVHDFHAKIYYLHTYENKFKWLNMWLCWSLKFDKYKFHSLLMLRTCDLLLISMVYLSCWIVRYSSDKVSYSFFTHNLGDICFIKNKMLWYHDSSCEKNAYQSQSIAIYKTNRKCYSNLLWALSTFEI